MLSVVIVVSRHFQQLVMAAGQAAFDAFISMHGSGVTAGAPEMAEILSQPKPNRALGLLWKPLAADLMLNDESSDELFDLLG